ncbi:MAG: hypothetical protein HYR72_00555 [Deltaproteobacteria bacterium]|nr:hypothetical protein [Deltaproteobacteria bacterium]MBI3389479.1 hypothetical protein [Deltaproteobacteria bacterium]
MDKPVERIRRWLWGRVAAAVFGVVVKRLWGLAAVTAVVAIVTGTAGQILVGLLSGVAALVIATLGLTLSRNQDGITAFARKRAGILSDCAEELLDSVEPSGLFYIETEEGQRFVSTENRFFFDSHDRQKRLEYLDALEKELASFDLVQREPRNRIDDAPIFSLTVSGWIRIKGKARKDFDRIFETHGQLTHTQEQVLRAMIEQPPATDLLHQLRTATHLYDWDLEKFREFTNRTPAGYWRNGLPTWDAARYFRAKKILGLTK